MIETTVDGRYLVVARIAAGGMGEVYRAHDPVLGREVAIKVLHPNFAADPGFIDRFRREARAAAMLSHPNIVAIHDWGETAGTYFMVMEYVRGPTLRGLLMRDGPLAPAQAVDVVTQVLGALEHAHARGIIHRDIKPENVMVRAADGVAKVADFGLARALADARVSQAPGTVTGTVQYLAPEQIEGQSADPRTDLYATGIVLYELLTGQVPFSGETSVAIAYRHLRDRVPPPSRSNPMVPPSLDQVVGGATERDRDRRTHDAPTMRHELDRAGPELPPAPSLTELAASAAPADEVSEDRASTVTIPRALPPKARRRRRLRAAFWTLAVLLALAAGAWAVWTYLIPHYTTAPTLEGRTVSAAQRLVTGAELELALREEFSTTVPPNTIISQNPPPGERIEVGSTISVVVSKGPEMTRVPNVVGKTNQAAKDAIRDADLRVRVREDFSDSVAPGDVISQTPDAGDRLEVGETVELTISRGPEPVSVPSVVGQPQGQAESELRAADLDVRVERDFSVEVDEGNVISQTPPEGQSVPPGTTVTIVVSQGPRQFSLPNVVGMSGDAATARLEGLDLVVRVVRVPGSSGQEVVSQRPPEGTTVRQGQRITIYIA
jgi:eukaryotic-like serine/threonine-protein kinase